MEALRSPFFAHKKATAANAQASTQKQASQQHHDKRLPSHAAWRWERRCPMCPPWNKSEKANAFLFPSSVIEAPTPLPRCTKTQAQGGIRNALLIATHNNHRHHYFPNNQRGCCCFSCASWPSRQCSSLQHTRPRFPRLNVHRRLAGPHRAQAHTFRSPSHCTTSSAACAYSREELATHHAKRRAQPALLPSPLRVSISLNTSSFLPPLPPSSQHSTTDVARTEETRS